MPEPITPMTAEELDELRALEQNATPGPWGWVSDGLSAIVPPPEPLDGTEEKDDFLGDQTWLVQGYPEPVCMKFVLYHPANQPQGADRSFIAAARTAVPRLLGEVKRLQADLQQLRDRQAGWTTVSPAAQVYPWPAYPTVPSPSWVGVGMVSSPAQCPSCRLVLSAPTTGVLPDTCATCHMRMVHVFLPEGSHEDPR